MIGMRLMQQLLNSNSKIALLGLLLERPYAFSVSELSRLASLPKSTVSLMVVDWVKAGLVETELQGRNKLVRLNPRFVLLADLRNIFGKSKNYSAVLFDNARRLLVLKNASVLAVMVFGSRVRGDFTHASDLDVLVVLEDKNHALTEKIVSAFLDLSERTGVRFAPVFLDTNEVLMRLREKDLFLRNILVEGKILKGEKWLEHAQAVS
ncbi:MAG: nucleotidyltransferase domain-containing protein [Candidatus Diapherotrites archaeon]|nr:nucleotidyltransferase domain-containing protein [Candidatus Diapherotrites archaeon]